MRLRIALLLSSACLGLGLTGCAAPAGGGRDAADGGRERDVVDIRLEAQSRLAQGDRRLREAQRSAGRLDHAIRAYQAALRLDPLLAEAHLRLATCYYLAQEHELEQSEYLKCLAVNARHVEAWQRLGHARLALDDLVGAREAYEQVLQLDPGDEVVLFNLHLVEADLGHDDRARQLLDQVHELARQRRPALVTSE